MLTKDARLRKQTDEEIPTDFLDELTERYVLGRQKVYSPQISDTLIDNMRESLLEGVKAGERIADLRDRINTVLIDEAPWRLQRIVRTETISGLNAGSFEGYKIMDVPKKEWLTARDPNVRGNEEDDEFSHVEADGQVVGVEEPFIVGGEELMYPGDPDGSAGNIIRCRCTTAPVIEEEVPVEEEA